MLTILLYRIKSTVLSFIGFFAALDALLWSDSSSDGARALSRTLVQPCLEIVPTLLAAGNRKAKDLTELTVDRAGGNRHGTASNASDSPTGPLLSHRRGLGTLVGVPNAQISLLANPCEKKKRLVIPWCHERQYERPVLRADPCRDQRGSC